MAGSAVPGTVIAEAIAAARGYLRITGEEEDALLARLTGAAILLGEAYCGTVLVARGFEDVLRTGSGWQRLRCLPVNAIQGVTGLPADGAPFVLPVGAYAIDIDADGLGWVRVTAPGGAGRVAVNYVAGLASTWGELSPPLAQGVVMLIAHLFQNREAENGGVAPPAAVAALWRPFRRMRLTGERHA